MTLRKEGQTSNRVGLKHATTATVGHFARDSCCPAENKECGKCGARGHFAVCCGNKKHLSSSQKGTVPENKKKA